MPLPHTVSAGPLPTAPSPAGLRLRDLLRSDIVHDVFVGGRLPSEPELMTAHGASRATVREALALLCQEGVITRRQRVGTVVTARVVRMCLIHAHGVKRPEPGQIPASFADARPRMLDASVVTCPASVSRLLGASDAEPCARIEYVSSSVAAGGAFALATNYVLMPEGGALLKTPFHRDWYTYLDDAGLQVGDDDFLIGALTADEGLAARLCVRRGDPLLFFEQVIRDPMGRAFNAAYIYLRADRMMLRSHAAKPTGSAR